MTSRNIVRVAPNAESLAEVKVKVKCPVSECSKTLRHKGSLMLHLKTVHNIKTDSKYHKPSLSEKVQFHCPVKSCAYHSESNVSQHFTSLQALKQHYIKVHAEKKYKCSHCDRGFAMESAQKRHQETCGTIYRCADCTCTYTSSEALLTHCKRHKHKPGIADHSSSNKGSIVGSNSIQPIVSSGNPANTTNAYFIVLPIVQQQYLPETSSGQKPILPKPISSGRVRNNVPIPAIITSSAQSQAQHVIPMTTVQHNYASIDSSSLNTLAELAIASESGQPKTLSVSSQAHLLDSCHQSEANSHSNSDPRQHLVFTTSYSNTGIPTQNLVAATSNLNLGITTQPLIATTSYESPVIRSRNLFSTSAYQDPEVTSSEFIGNSMTTSSRTMQTSQILSDNANAGVMAGIGTQTTECSVKGTNFRVPTSHKASRRTKAKQSKSSQVSPRVKNCGPLFGNTITMQSCETQTMTQFKSLGQDEKRQRGPRRRLIDVSSQSSQTLGAGSNVSHKLPRSKRRKLQSESKNVCTNTVELQSSNIGTCSRSGSGLDNVMPLQSDFSVSVAESNDLQNFMISEFAGLSDSETQTIAVLEELTSSLASTISTQTSKSFLAQPQSIGVGTEPENVQDIEARTSVCAFSRGRKPESGLVNTKLDLSEHTGSDTLSNALDYIDNLAWEEEMHNPLVCPSSQVDPLISTTSEGDVNSHTTVISYGELRPTPRLVTAASQSVHNHDQSAFAQTTTFPLSSISASTGTQFSNIGTEFSPEVDLDLFSFLDAGIQADSGPGTTTHTQTVDDIWELFGQNMETQTCDDLFFSDLGFSDIHTQTNLDFLASSVNQQSTETQTSLHTASSALFGDNAEKSDIETQTMFPLFDFDYAHLIDTHTQTNL